MQTRASSRTPQQPDRETRYESAGDTGSTSLKRLPGAGVRAKLDPAAECDRELASDREPEASPFRVLRDERLEDLRALRRRYARPGVDDVDRDDAVRRTEPELDAAAVRGPAKGVREEVRDDLQHAISVRHDDGRGLLPRQRVVDLAAARLLGEGAVGLVEHALEVDLLLPHREAMGLELGEVEHVSDQALEPVGLGGDDLERDANLLGLAHDHPRGSPRRVRESPSAASGARATPT